MPIAGNVINVWSETTVVLYIYSLCPVSSLMYEEPPGVLVSDMCKVTSMPICAIFPTGYCVDMNDLYKERRRKQALFIFQKKVRKVHDIEPSVKRTNIFGDEDLDMGMCILCYLVIHVCDRSELFSEVAAGHSNHYQV